jgi:nucleoside-diphosphate-sugar epimerase
MKYLILGSKGQIGSHLFDYLKQKGYQVDGFDIVNSEKEDLRIQNNELLDLKIKDSDFVYFLAFDVGGSRYLKQYQNTFEFINNNSKIMDVTFTSLKKYKKPFIFASSQMSAMDYSSYGTLKKIGEYYTKSLGGLNTRFWNVYGIEKDFEKSHVITDFIQKAIKTKKIDMITDGVEERQFLFAEDCCECLLKLSQIYNDIDKKEEYHVSNFEWTKVIDIAKIISKYIPCEIIPSSNSDDVQKNLKNDPNKNILKYWSPKTSLDNGIQEIIKYYKNV